MFCQQCGTQIEDGLAFCTSCGAKQIAVADTPANNEKIGTQQPQPTVDAQYQQPDVQPAYIAHNQQPNNQPAYTAQTTTQPAFNTQPQYASIQQEHSGSPKKVSFGEAIKLFFINYANFKGRSTASEYWFAYLFNFIVSLCTSWIPVIGMLVSLGLLLPGLSLGIRRLHDTGKAWTYMLMGLIPIAGIIILIIQYCKASDADNKWGPAPRD